MCENRPPLLHTLTCAPSCPLQGYECKRPPLATCTEEEFLADLYEFTSLRRAPAVLDRSRFPDAVLNGTPLDVLGLYREVVTRGGIRVGMAGGINWRGQVCVGGGAMRGVSGGADEGCVWGGSR